MSDKAIIVENISKVYDINQRSDTLTQSFAKLLKKKTREPFWALKDISFEVAKGECLGVIGHNGAGKSTLLKILSKITPPTKGMAKIHGRVSSLLEVGTGFHPELTGRENIFLNGTLLGMSRKEIRVKLEEIIDFSGVEKFIDTPVKKYSSGMYVRLAFSVAAHLDSDVLLVDEVLSVGDWAFRMKCISKMESLKESRRKTLLFVSHNLGVVSEICDRSMLLEKGKIKDIGPSQDVINCYLGPKNIEKFDNKEQEGSDLIIEEIFLESNFARLHMVNSGDDFEIKIKYQANRSLDNVLIKFELYDEKVKLISIINSRLTEPLFRLDKGRGVLTCKIKRLPINTGSYSLLLTVKENGSNLYCGDRRIKIDIGQGSFYTSGSLPGERSRFLLDYKWSLKEHLP